MKKGVTELYFMKRLKLFIISIPVLLLLIPLSVNGALITASLLYIMLFVFYKEFKENKFFRIDKKAIISGVIVDVLLSTLFYIKWSPFGTLEKIAKVFHINHRLFLLIITVLLAVLSLYGICVITAMVESFAKHINKSKCLNWLKSETKDNKQKVLLSLLLAFFIVLAQGSLPIYSDLDNFGIAMVLNGTYSSDNICLFVSPLLSSIVRLINNVIPYADGYILFMELSLSLAFWLLLFVLFSISKSNLSVVLFYIPFLSACLFMNIFHANFTLFTGMMCVIGLIGMFAFWIRKVGVLTLLFSIGVFGTGCMFRFYGMLLLLPFAFLVVVFELWNNRKRIKEYLPRLLVVVLAVIICVFGNWLVNKSIAKSEKYLSSQTYNSARFHIFDFKTKEWNQVAEKLEQMGVSENDYQLLKVSVLADTDVFTADYLNHISQVVKLSIGESLSEMPNKLSEVYYVIQTDPIILLSLILFLLVLFLALFFTRIKVNRILEMIIGYLITIAVVVFFAVVGRIPSYVIKTILLGGYFVLASIIISDPFKLQVQTKSLKCILLGVTLTFLILTYSSVEKVSGGFAFNSFFSRVGQSDVISDEKIYLWGTNSYNQYVNDSFLMHNKLPTDQFINSNINDGKWTYGQVYFEEYLAKNNMTNPMKSLLEKDVYYVADKSRCDKVLSYLNEHYSSDISVTETGEINGISVWKYYV